MLEILVNFVFNIVNKLISTLMSPVISAVTSLFPSLGVYFGYITSFFSTMCTYVISCSKLLLVPTSFWTALFAYIEIKFSIYLVIVAVQGTIKLYNYFKP